MASRYAEAILDEFIDAFPDAMERLEAGLEDSLQAYAFGPVRCAESQFHECAGTAQPGDSPAVSRGLAVPEHGLVSSVDHVLSHRIRGGLEYREQLYQSNENRSPSGGATHSCIGDRGWHAFTKLRTLLDTTVLRDSVHFGCLHTCSVYSVYTEREDVRIFYSLYEWYIAHFIVWTAECDLFFILEYIKVKQTRVQSVGRFVNLLQRLRTRS